MFLTGREYCKKFCVVSWYWFSNVCVTGLDFLWIYCGIAWYLSMLGSMPLLSTIIMNEFRIIMHETILSAFEDSG